MYFKLNFCFLKLYTISVLRNPRGNQCVNPNGKQQSWCGFPSAEFRVRKEAPSDEEIRIRFAESRAEFKAIAEFCTQARGILHLQACGIPFL